MGVGSGSGHGCALAGDEVLEDLAALGSLGALGLDVGVGEARGGGDERGAGEEEAGRGGALPPGRRVLQPRHVASCVVGSVEDGTELVRAKGLVKTGGRQYVFGVSRAEPTGSRVSYVQARKSRACMDSEQSEKKIVTSMTD